MAELTHFKCDDCGHIWCIEDRAIVKAAYTCFDWESEQKFVSYHYHIQLCNDCKIVREKHKE